MKISTFKSEFLVQQIKIKQRTHVNLIHQDPLSPLCLARYAIFKDHSFSAMIPELTSEHNPTEDC